MIAATARALRSGRRWRAPEVVQTSAMDCGPAALKCLLEGHHIPVSYGRLREACQTDVDGTSIDQLEAVANQLGVRAEQWMIPLDHLLLDAAQALPAVVVTRLPDGATHFVVLWRRHGPWLQVMDPATGLRWVSAARFAAEVFQHQLPVPADDWRAWAGGAEFQPPLRARLRALGLPAAAAQAWLDRANADAGWFALGALDAALRLASAVQRAGGVAAGAPAQRLLAALFEATLAAPDDIHRHVPAAYWSVAPEAAAADDGSLALRLRGAVLVRVLGRSLIDKQAQEGVPPLSRELAAALRERAPHPLRTVWQLLRQDGALAPLALALAALPATAAVALQTLLLRGLIDIAGQLGTAPQRAAAMAALGLATAVLLALQLPQVHESLRLGRQLETRLRRALLSRLPRLGDRYFQSRALSDMAERAHGVHAVRGLPGLGLQCLQVACELLVTLGALLALAPHSAWPALISVAVAAVLALAAQPLLAERDMRLHSHAAALLGFQLDALLGLVPVRTHRAQRALRRQHEALLVDWTLAGRALRRLSLTAGGAQALAGTALASWLLWAHFAQARGIGGADLLLVFWGLRLPALGSQLAGLAQQYPAQRNALLRLLEPLQAPDDAAPADGAPIELPAAASHGLALDVQDGAVVASGHTLLQGLNLHIAAGEHVAVVGASGAGKSSLIGLLLGWHRLAAGMLRVDGQALDAATQATLRRHCAWVDPAIQLWNRSLLDNLVYACDEADGVAPAELGRAIDAAGLRSVLQALPQGLQTPLGEGGALLSGGEGQRVRLARALLQRGVRLALLDEPFRGLDRAQRRQLLADTRRWWQGATLLCVTHDVGETRGFDRVLVIADGRIVEDGVPATLAAQPGSHYATLLAAEAALHAQLWQGAAWRRLRLQEGRLQDGRLQAPAAEPQRMS